MKHALRMAATAAALIASAGLAAAANSGAKTDGTPMAKPAAVLSDIVLTATQDATIWHDLSAKSDQKAPVGFRAAVGGNLPNSVALNAFPRKMADNILTLAGMQYAKLNDQVLVVRTRDRKIEGIVTPAQTKS